MRLTILIAAALLGSGLAQAQSMVEYGAIAAAAGSASGGASKLGAALEKSLKSVDGSLRARPADTPAGKSSRQSQAALDRRPAPPPPPKPAKETLAAVQVGWEKAQLMAKAGQPAFSIVSSDEEVLSYVCREGAAFTVIVKDGKVSEVKEK